jgi:hypothetical protein
MIKLKDLLIEATQLHIRDESGKIIPYVYGKGGSFEDIAVKAMSKRIPQDERNPGEVWMENGKIYAKNGAGKIKGFGKYDPKNQFGRKAIKQGERFTDAMSFAAGHRIGKPKGAASSEFGIPLIWPPKW